MEKAKLMLDYLYSSALSAILNVFTVECQFKKTVT